MLAELLPFLTKYWYHVLICVISCTFLKILFHVSKREAVFIENVKHKSNNLDDTVEQLEGNCTARYCYLNLYFLQGIAYNTN